MQDDVIINKIATIERCVQRVKEEYAKEEFYTSYTYQDAAILNIQRACEASLDIGQYIIRYKSLGIVQSARDVFAILDEHKYISESLSIRLQKAVGFRNIAVHEYININFDIVESIISKDIDDFLEFTRCILAYTEPT